MTDDHRAALRDYMTAREAYVMALKDYKDAYPHLREALTAYDTHLRKSVWPWSQTAWQLTLERLERAAREAKRSYREASGAVRRTSEDFLQATLRYDRVIRALPPKS